MHSAAALADALIPDALVDSDRVAAYLHRFVSTVQCGEYLRAPVSEAFHTLAEDAFALTVLVPGCIEPEDRDTLSRSVDHGAAAAWLEPGCARSAAVPVIRLALTYPPSPLPPGMPGLLLNRDIASRGRFMLYLALSRAPGWSSEWGAVARRAVYDGDLYADTLLLLALSLPAHDAHMPGHDPHAQWRWCRDVAERHPRWTTPAALLAGAAVRNPLYDAARALTVARIDGLAARVAMTPPIRRRYIDCQQIPLFPRHFDIVSKTNVLRRIEENPFLRPSFTWNELRPFDPSHPTEPRPPRRQP